MTNSTSLLQYNRLSCSAQAGTTHATSTSVIKLFPLDTLCVATPADCKLEWLT